MTSLLQYNDTIECKKNKLSDDYFSIKIMIKTNSKY